MNKLYDNPSALNINLQLKQSDRKIIIMKISLIVLEKKVKISKGSSKDFLKNTFFSGMKVN